MIKVLHTEKLLEAFLFLMISILFSLMYLVRKQIVNRINLFKLYNVHQRFFFKIVFAPKLYSQLV